MCLIESAVAGAHVRDLDDESRWCPGGVIAAASWQLQLRRRIAGLHELCGGFVYRLARTGLSEPQATVHAVERTHGQTHLILLGGEADQNVLRLDVGVNKVALVHIC